MDMTMGSNKYPPQAPGNGWCNFVPVYLTCRGVSACRHFLQVNSYSTRTVDRPIRQAEWRVTCRKEWTLRCIPRQERRPGTPKLQWVMDRYIIVIRCILKCVLYRKSNTRRKVV